MAQKEPLRSQLLALDERDIAPRWGKIDYDVNGKLVGNWFRVGSGGYAGMQRGGEGYWDGNLAVVYDGNDGGIYRTSNIYAVLNAGWENLNNGLAVTQFYSGAGRTAAGGRIIGGTQDNGSLQLGNGVWRPWRGGDGGMVAIDPAGDQVFYGEYVYLAIHRSQNGGRSGYICTGITEALPNDTEYASLALPRGNAEMQASRSIVLTPTPIF